MPPDSASTLDRRDLVLAMLGVCAVTVIVAMDATIIGTTLPRVATELQGMHLYAWVGTLYMLVSAVAIPLFGRLGDLYGRKPFMLTSVVIVALGSALCGLSQSMPQLIAARAFQGLGSGMLIATAFAAPADLFPDPARRLRWQAMISAAFAMASGLGPMLGGAITEWFGWRAAFAVIPINALVALYLLARYFPRFQPVHTEPPRFDWLGALLLAAGVGLPLAALELYATRIAGPLTSLGLLALGLASLWLLPRVERSQSHPMFPATVLERPESRLLNVLAVFTGAVMFLLIYYGPLLLQTEYGASPKQAGLLLTPLVLGIPFGSVLSGRLFPRLSAPQRLLALGAMLLALGCLGLLWVEAGVAAAWVMLAFALCGFGLGFLLPNLTLFSQLVAQRRDVGMASALIQTTRALGSAVSVALVGLLIARLGVLEGMRVGLVAGMALCAMLALLSRRLHMHNRLAKP